MKQFLHDNGLSLALLLAFLLSAAGMVVTGHGAESEDLIRHGRPALSLLAYAGSAAFISALFENWESEFLQMSTYVVLTAFLFQRGSAESKDPDQSSPEDADPADEVTADSPWPVRAGGLVRFLYSYSLGIALAALFAVSFILHWLASARAANSEGQMHGEAPVTAAQYLADPQFWFESFQNWQSEFLSTAVLVILSIFLRFRGSPESKPVAAPAAATDV